ncbi:MAG: hypothetical protein BGO26_13605 [Actinobacteria bacterium 69-20]|nr:ABC transporter permease [Actinomycetota bacterium]OJV27621.1 MAG: hypothetical protein BGO26_13605 [Actinobacteria bacterium 69-20]
MTGYFARLECLRMLRDPRYLALAVVAPIGFYLLFASLFGGGMPGRLPGTVEIMVAMAAYGAIWGALSATGPRIAHERAGGWLQQLQAMPVAARQVMAAKLAAGMTVTLPALVLVCLTAAVVKGVRLDTWQWATLLAVMWVGSLPFVVMGVAIGFVVGAEAAFPLSYGLYMAMAALGGLWVPPAQLPAALRQLAGALPSYRLADLGWRIAAGSAPSAADVAILAAWTAGLGLLAALAYRRRPRRRLGSGPRPGPRRRHASSPAAA